jgi:hypothetical protein
MLSCYEEKVAQRKGEKKVLSLFLDLKYNRRKNVKEGE